MKSALILAVCVLLVVAAPGMTAAQDDDIKKMDAEDREKYQKALRVRRLKELKKIECLSSQRERE